MKKYLLLLVMLSVHVGCTGKTGQELYSDGVKALREGNSGSAIVLFRSALEKEQNRSDARYQLAKAYVAEGRYALAEKEFQKVYRQNPAHPEINLDLAQLYVALKKPDLALSHAEQYRADNPDSSGALEAVGSAYLIKLMPDHAEAYFLKALQQTPDRQSTRLELAELYLQQAKPLMAQPLLEEVIKGNPVHIRGNHLLADVKLALGHKVEARSIYQKLIDTSSNDPQALYKAGLLDMESGSIASVEAYADDLVKKFPNHAEGYRLKGFVLFVKQNFSDAITSLQHANKLQPSLAGHYYLGLSLFGTGNLESALSQFRLILDRAPTFHKARLLSGLIFLQQNRLDDAMAEANKLIEADDRNALAHNLLGSAYLAKGMREEGTSALNRSFQLDPRLKQTVNRSINYHLARLHQARMEQQQTNQLLVELADSYKAQK